jgi:hypothetical protein
MFDDLESPQNRPQRIQTPKRHIDPSRPHWLVYELVRGFCWGLGGTLGGAVVLYFLMRLGMAMLEDKFQSLPKMPEPKWVIKR